jgi:type IX secretion system PorP/SprF family membrane protein
LASSADMYTMLRKPLLIFCLLMMSGLHVQAQQQSLFSHYFWNEQHYNPGYAGSRDMLHVQALYRLQWAGFDGAPQTANATVHSPLRNERFALGMNIYNDRIGAYQSNGVSFQYAFRVPLTPKIKLSIGIQGGLEFGNINFNDLVTDDGISDPVNANWNQRSLTPVVGTGFYLYGEQFSVGFGVPQLMNSNIIKSEKTVLDQVNHYYLSGAYQFNINDDIRLLPTAVLRITKGAPFQAEINMSAILYDMFQAGLGVRTDKTVVLMMQAFPKITEKKCPIRIGYAYDIATRPIRPVSAGSHELMLSFGMPRSSTPLSPKIKSPRYF